MTRLLPILAALLISCFSSAQLQVKNYFSVTGKKDVNVNVIGQDSTGFLILGTSEGAYRFDGRISESLCKNEKCLKQEITALLVDSDNKIYLGTRRKRS